jgi:hypothetical protein
MEPTRLYLQKSNNDFSPLLWFHNNKANEMLFGIYGLIQKQPILTLEFPEYILADNELDAVRYNYKEANVVNKQLDHITCHSDGKFHLKTINDSEDCYIHQLKSNIPLGPNVPIFFQFQIISDLVANYQLINIKPRDPYVAINLSDNQCLSMRGAFAGIDFDLKKEMGQTLTAINKGNPFMQSAVILTSNSLQGIFFWQANNLSEDAKKGRPRGTIASFMFSTIDNKNLIKTFIFE